MVFSISTQHGASVSMASANAAGESSTATSMSDATRFMSIIDPSVSGRYAREYVQTAQNMTGCRAAADGVDLMQILPYVMEIIRYYCDMAIQVKNCVLYSIIIAVRNQLSKDVVT